MYLLDTAEICSEEVLSSHNVELSFVPNFQVDAKGDQHIACIIFDAICMLASVLIG